MIYNLENFPQIEISNNGSYIKQPILRYQHTKYEVALIKTQVRN